MHARRRARRVGACRSMVVGKGTEEGMRAASSLSPSGTRTIGSIPGGGNAMNVAPPALDVIPLVAADAAPPLSHFQALEAESIHIIREAVAESDNPVLLYSIGKDSSVLLHLALKAFHPAKPPFPLLHIDTTWKFRDMIAFRDRRAHELGLKLIVHV